MPNIIKWFPLPWLPDDYDKIFQGLDKYAAGFMPAIDLYQTAESVIVETPLPGLNPEDIELTVEHDVLTIQGKAEHKSEVEEKDYYRHEVKRGSFFRSVDLPVQVQGDKANATYHNGILKVVIPSRSAQKLKKSRLERITNDALRINKRPFN